MDLPAEQREEIRRRLEGWLDVADRRRGAGRDERIEALATRVRQAEERLAQAQKMEAIGRLTGGIAHDFNNLLTGILGYSSLLKTSLPENGQGYEAAAYIERSARRASELTRQLLAYSRRETPTFRPVDLRRVTGEAIEILSRTVNRNVEIHIDFHVGATLARPKREPPIRPADQLTNRQTNLLGERTDQDVPVEPRDRDPSHGRSHPLWTHLGELLRGDLARRMQPLAHVTKVRRAGADQLSRVEADRGGLITPAQHQLTIAARGSQELEQLWHRQHLQIPGEVVPSGGFGGGARDPLS